MFSDTCCFNISPCKFIPRTNTKGATANDRYPVNKHIIFQWPENSHDPLCITTLPAKKVNLLYHDGENSCIFKMSFFTCLLCLLFMFVIYKIICTGGGESKLQSRVMDGNTVVAQCHCRENVTQLTYHVHKSPSHTKKLHKLTKH